MSTSTNLLLKQLTNDVQNIKKQLANLQIQPTKDVILSQVNQYGENVETVIKVPAYETYITVTEPSVFGKISEGTLCQYPYTYPIITNQRGNFVYLQSVYELNNQYIYENGTCSAKPTNWNYALKTGPLLSYNGTRVTKITFQESIFTLASKGIIENMDTSLIEDMSYMFYKAGRVLDASSNNTSDYLWMINFDTSNVKNMSHMFDLLADSEWYIGNMNTMNVTDMSYMFANITSSSVSIRGISSFDTHNVIDMSYMFYGSYSIFGDNENESWNNLSIDLRWLDISNLTNFEQMLNIGGTRPDIYFTTIICFENIANWIKNNINTLGLNGTIDNWTYDNAQQTLSYQEI